jgi:hypothetical protein
MKYTTTSHSRCQGVALFLLEIIQNWTVKA